MNKVAELPDTPGMTKLAVAFRLGRGKPLACYMCKHSDVSDTRLCSISQYTKAWHNLFWSMQKLDLQHSQSNYSAAEFCQYFEHDDNHMLNSRDQALLHELTKV